MFDDVESTRSFLYFALKSAIKYIDLGWLVQV